jgi:hypothetical protein
MTMSKRWYYNLGGAQYGPAEETELVQLINSGDLPPGTPVLKEGSKDWSAARNHACLTGNKETTLKPIPKPATAEPNKTDKPERSTPHHDEKFYEQVATELGGDSRKQGLWLKAETKAQGDIDKARLLYAEWRVGQLVEKERETQRKEEEKRLAKKKVEREREREATQKKEDLARKRAQQHMEEEQKRLAKEAVEREREARQEKEVLAKKKAQQHIEDEAKLKAVVKTLEKATACIAPLSRFGYEVVSSKLIHGKPFWEIVDPHLQKSVDVPQDRLVRYVRQQITIYSYMVNCPRCDTPLEEVRKAIWECPKC